MAHEPEVKFNYEGAPYAEVFFPSFAPGTASVTIFRESGGRTYEVRGGVRAATAGTLTRLDNEIPAAEMTYWAEMFNGAGLPLGITGSTTVTAWYEGTWLHNPLNPAGAVRVTVLNTAAKSISRPTPGSVVYPLGRRVGVVVAEPRRGISGLTFDVFTECLDDADRVQQMLGSYEETTVPVVCVRVGRRDGAMRIPKPLFLGVLDISEEEVDVHRGGEAIVNRMQGDEVSPPVPGLFVPLLTRADINSYYSTRAAVAADNLTRGDVNRRYDLAGGGA